MRCPDRGVHRGPRALRERAGKPPPYGVSSAGNLLRTCTGGRSEVRYFPCQVERDLSQEVGYYERSGKGASGRHRERAEKACAQCLSTSQDPGIRTPGRTTHGKRGTVCDRSESESIASAG